MTIIRKSCFRQNSRTFKHLSFFQGLSRPWI